MQLRPSTEIGPRAPFSVAGSRPSDKGERGEGGEGEKGGGGGRSPLS